MVFQWKIGTFKSIWLIQMNNWNFTFTNIIPMSKTQTVTNQTNLFSLVRLHPQCYYRDIQVDFTPPVSLSLSSNSIIPSFLKDGKFYTPAFILPRDKHYYERTQDFEKYKFKEKILKETEEDQRKPNHQNLQGLEHASPTSHFCQVCKTTFTSYFQHVEESSHLTKIKGNKANQYIAQLCKKVNRRYKNQNKKARSKKISKKGKQIKSAKGGKTRNKQKLQEKQMLLAPMKSCTNSTNA